MKSFLSPLFCTLLLIAFSFNAFSQWERQHPLPKMENVLDIAIHGDGYGFAVGTNDLALWLDPETKKWELLQGLQKGWRLVVADYLESGNGTFLAAGGPGLLVSNDAGSHWQEIENAPAGIHALKIITATSILVSADAGVFIWENNTWTNLNVPDASGISSAFILDRNHIWCFNRGAIPLMFYTTDGGQNWSENTDLERPDMLRFFNTQYGVAADGRDIYHTTDGGQNWILTSSNTIPTSSNDLAFGSSANILLTATQTASPAISIDSGRTWMTLNTGLLAQRTYSVAAFSDTEYWVGNDISSIVHSTNSGMNWTEASGPFRSQLQDVYFFNRLIGFAAGSQGTIFRTLNGGKDWENISFGETRTYYCLHGRSEDRIWMGASQRIFLSTDLGATWEVKANIGGGNINDIYDLNNDRILACSSSGIIYRSDDEGTTWDTMYNAGTQLRSIARIDDQRFMITGFNGTILRSQDQGETWLLVTPPKPAIQYEQSFFLEDHGWLISSSFEHEMWHTENAGDTWETITLPIDRFWDGVYFISPDTGFAVCRSNVEGRAYTTINGGQTWQAAYITNFPLFGVTGLPKPNGVGWIFGYGSDIETRSFCETLPQISDLAGDLFPCQNDTITYMVQSQNTDEIHWSFPIGWTIIGESDSNIIQVRAGATAGTISVNGQNICGLTDPLNVHVDVQLLPAISSISGDLTPCAGEITTYIFSSQHADQFTLLALPSDWQFLGFGFGLIDFLVGTEPWSFTIQAQNDCAVAEAESPLLTPFVVPSIQIVINGNLLSLTHDAMIYQWFLNGVLIPGATGATLEVVEDGVYHAEVIFAAGCAASTGTVDVMITSLFHHPDLLQLDVHPVPARDMLYVSGPTGDFTYSIYDATGRLISKANSGQSGIPVRHLPNGLYMMQVVKGDDIYAGRFVIGK